MEIGVLITLLSLAKEKKARHLISSGPVHFILRQLNFLERARTHVRDRKRLQKTPIVFPRLSFAAIAQQRSAQRSIASRQRNRTQLQRRFPARVQPHKFTLFLRIQEDRKSTRLNSSHGYIS